MWILQLNMMRNRTEILTVVGWAETKEDLVAFVEVEKNPGGSWDDGDSGVPDGFGTGSLPTWRKSFKKGSTLKWFNAPMGTQQLVGLGEPAYKDVGTEGDWIREAVESFAKLRICYPKLVP